MEKIIGIDLGTSNSAAAVYDGVKATIIPAVEGASVYGKAFPSYVAFTDDGELLVGEAARTQAITNPERTITKVKRLMGTDEKIMIDGKQYTPQDISAYILQKIKQDAEVFVGEPIHKAVITVPAYFDDNQRTATKDAGIIAGLEVVRIINEPTAAALAYGVDKQTSQNANIMVYDLGGGTLDVTIMEFGAGDFKVISTSGDTHLGGTDMDAAIIDYLAGEFRKEHGFDILANEHARKRLEEAVENAKIRLSTVTTSEINLPFIATDDDNNPINFIHTLTRAKLEELVMPIIERSAETMQRALDDAHLSKQDINNFILVGGPTRMPIVKKYCEDFMGQEVVGGLDPMECVALGAAIQGGVIGGEITGISIVDVTPLSLGTGIVTGETAVLIPRNTPIPVSASDNFTTVNDNQPAILFDVLQGERVMAKDNVSLGEFLLDGIPPAPAGMPHIEVTFAIDANGILNASAKDMRTGNKASITISSPNKLSPEEIQLKVMEAEKFAKKDQEKKDLANAINDAQRFIRVVEKSLDQHATSISPVVRGDIEQAIFELRRAIDDENIYNINSCKMNLENVAKQIGQNIYR